MPRRTVHLPDSTEKLVREHARGGESFSATIVRLVELGAAEDIEFGPGDVQDEEFPLGYLGSGDSGLPGLGINAEKYLGLKPWGPGERPAGLDDEDRR